VRPEGREDVDEAAAVELVDHARKWPRLAGIAGVVRRHGDDPPVGRQIAEDAEERLAEVVLGEDSGRRAGGEVKHVEKGGWRMGAEGPD
jgi:hypothetical protein